MIEELIQQGEEIKQKYTRNSDIGTFIYGEEYAKWIYDCRLYLETTFSHKSFTQDFINESKNAVGNDIKHYVKMIAILKSVRDGINKGLLEG